MHVHTHTQCVCTYMYIHTAIDDYWENSCLVKLNKVINFRQLSHADMHYMYICISSQHRKAVCGISSTDTCVHVLYSGKTVPRKEV